MPSLTAAPIAVTGASGYIASWIVRELLARGATVHGTVRDPDNRDKVGFLRDMAAELPGTLELFAADLLEPGSFAEALAGCHIVMHTASPFLLGKPSDPQKELIDPALQGTRNVLRQVNETPSVERVVLTSSAAAVYCDNVDCAAAGGVLNEEHWNTTSSLDHEPYTFSKTVAEREAWKLADAQDRWRLVVVNPTFVMGPSLAPSRGDGASVSFLRRTIDGTWRTGTLDLSVGWVDVRDVATAHVEAAIRDDAEGRHLLCAGVETFFEAGKIIERKLGSRVKVPMWAVPKALAYVMGPLNGVTIKYVSRNVGHPLKFDTTRSKERLGLTYRPLQETLVEHAEQLLDDD
jgi:nucleoside-diphosphate-sugar epimerase